MQLPCSGEVLAKVSYFGAEGAEFGLEVGEGGDEGGFVEGVGRCALGVR